VRDSFSFPNPATYCRRGCRMSSSKIPLASLRECQGSVVACFCPRTPHVAMVLSWLSPIPAARRWHYRGIRFDASHVALRIGDSDRRRVAELQQRVWNGDGRQRADALGRFGIRRPPAGLRRRPIVSLASDDSRAYQQFECFHRKRPANDRTPRARFRFVARRCSRHCVCSKTRCDGPIAGIRQQNRRAATRRSRDFAVSTEVPMTRLTCLAIVVLVAMCFSNASVPESGSLLAGALK